MIGRVLVHAAAAALLTALLLALSGWLHAEGFLSGDALSLWAKAILVDEGGPVLGGDRSFYPPLPFLLTVGVQMLPLPEGPPPPVIAACLLGGWLGSAWFFNLQGRGGYSAPAAALVSALLVLNPVFLRAVAEGPGDVLLIAGIWMIGRGFFNLRLSGAAHDMMKFALGLLILAFSHRYGLLLVLASLPFAAVAARPSLLSASPFGYLAALFFPIFCAAGAFAFLSWIFAGGLIDELFVGAASPDTALARGDWTRRALLVLAAGPAVIAGALRVAGSARLVMPLLAVGLTVVSASLLDDGFGFMPDPALAAAPMLAAAFVALRFWPASPMRAPAAVACAVLGVAGGALAASWSQAPETQAWRAAMLGRGAGDPLASARSVAERLRDAPGVMLDPEANPDLVAALGRLPDPVLPGAQAFDLAQAAGRPGAAFVAVRLRPDALREPDAVLRAFPAFATEDPPGYDLVLREGGWRVYRRRTGTDPGGAAGAAMDGSPT